MKSLALLAWGQILVFIDFRIDGFDLIPDPLGWGMCAAAAASLSSLHRGYVYAGWASLIGVVVSLPDWVDPEAASGALGVVMLVVSTALVFATCTAIMATAPSRAGTARAIRASDLLLTAVLVLVTLLTLGEPDAAPLIFVVGLGVLGVYIWFLVLLFGCSKLPPPASGRAGRR